MYADYTYVFTLQLRTQYVELRILSKSKFFQQKLVLQNQTDSQYNYTNWHRFNGDR